uniref:Poly [ADP-ribose] polymerase n=1 Tax=Oryza glumipatula TaxID=40148 RepID=A0A0D9Z4B3_9ORYZ
MDFSGDVKPAIHRPSVAAARGGGNSGAIPLLRGWQAFRRSGAPARLLCFEGGAWADVAGEVVGLLRRAFMEGKAVCEAACGGRVFLFDFMRMVRIDEATAEEAALGWIDDRGACFFPAPEGGRKRKRERDEAGSEVKGEDRRRRQPAAEEEDGDEASSGVEERSGESRPEADEPDRKKARGTLWGKAVRLDEADKFYKVVEKLFVSRMAPVAAARGVAITAVHKVAQGPRARAFHLQGQLLAAARGVGDGSNAKFAWYGAPAADVAAAVEHGFGRTNGQFLGGRAHGDGVHLSPPQYPHASAMLTKPDENGEAHIVLCRVLMGRPEAVPASSPQFHPSSDEYDSAVDNLENPRWYVVWSTDMNTRILPEYVVSFRWPNLPQMEGSSGLGSKLKKPSPATTRDMFPMLLTEIQRFVPSPKLQTLQRTYNCFKRGQMKKDQFIRFLRSHIGDNVLTTVAKKLRGY